MSTDGLGRLYLVERVGTGERHLLRVVDRAVTAGGPRGAPALGEHEGPPDVRDWHVAAVTEAGETSDGLVYLVMEPFDGTLLADLVAPEVTRPPVEVAELVHQAAEGLAAAHAEGVAHGTLSLTSLMVVGGPPRIVVLDLGLAALLRQRAPAVQVLRYLDPHTTAPEVLAGAAPDPRSDVYSLGALAHRLLTGYLPDQGVADGPAATAAGALPAAVRAVLETALAPAPADRLGVRALAAALAAAIPLPYAPAAVSPSAAIARSPVSRLSEAFASARVAWASRRAQGAALGLALTAALLWIVGTNALTLRSSPVEAVRQAMPDAGAEDEESGNVSDQPPATEPQRPAVRPTAPPESDADKQPRPVAARRPMLLPGQRESSAARLDPEPDVAPEPADVVTNVSPAPTPTVPEAARDSTARLTDPEPAGESPPPSRRLDAKALVAPPPPNPAAPDASRDAMLARAAASQAIGQVARAVEARDLVALRLALPELTDEARTGWAQLFEVARDLRATLTVRDVVVRGVLADAQVAGTYEFWNRSLNRRERVPILAEATLIRDVGGWRMSAWR